MAAEGGEEDDLKKGDQDEDELKELNDAAPPPASGEALEQLIYNAQLQDKVKEVGVVQTAVVEQATVTDFGSVLGIHEIIPPGERLFAKKFYLNFLICQRFMTFLGRLPITSHVDANTHAVIFDYHGSSCRGCTFFTTFTLLLLITFLSTLNIFSTMLNLPYQPKEFSYKWDLKVKNESGEVVVNWKPAWHNKLPFPSYAAPIEGEYVTGTKTRDELRAEELFIFRRNLAPLVIIVLLLYHIVISDWNLFGRRNFISHYLTFWTESVEIMKIDAAGGAGKYCRQFLLYYILWFVLFSAGHALLFAPVSSGAPLSFFLLWIRVAFPPAHALNDLFILIFRVIGGTFYLYVVLCSKVYVLFFLFICKVLTTASNVWTERLEKVFTIEERGKSRKDRCDARTGHDHLFKDYVNLLDLMSGADTLFTNIIESYFSTTLISIVFEVYYLIRPISESQTEFQGARTLDMIIVASFLFNSLMIFYLVTSGAAEVGESVANGLETIRRQGIMGHRSDEEMHFMLSLYMSYTGHFDTALSGGGYFNLDKPFLISIAGAMISYIIIIFQFQPTLGITNPEQRVQIGLKLPGETEEMSDQLTYRRLIFHVESTFRWLNSREPGTTRSSS